MGGVSLEAVAAGKPVGVFETSSADLGGNKEELRALRFASCVVLCESVLIVFCNCCIRCINGPCLIGGRGGRFRFGTSAARPLIPVLMH